MEWWKNVWFIQTSYYQRVSKTPQKRAFSERNPCWWISRESQSRKTHIFLDVSILATASVMQPPGHKDNTSPPNEFGRKGSSGEFVIALPFGQRPLVRPHWVLGFLIRETRYNRIWKCLYSQQSNCKFDWTEIRRTINHPWPLLSKEGEFMFLRAMKLDYIREKSK